MRKLAPGPIVFAAIPAAIYLVYTVLLLLPPTRPFFIEQLAENGPIELATFAMMTLAGLLGFALVWRVRRTVARPVLAGLVLCALGFSFIGMEEIAWGQHFFGWETPAAIAWRNAQHETTLHNHHELQDILEIFAVLYALAGLLGVLLHRANVLRPLMPRPILFYWFLPLLVVAGLDLMCVFWAPSRAFYRLVNHLDEVNEMICSMCALAFVVFKRRELGPAASTGPLAPRGPSAGSGRP